MTKKDYILIAKLVSETLSGPVHASQHDSTVHKRALYRFAYNFSTEARNDNPRFDKNRFLKACGFED